MDQEFSLGHVKFGVPSPHLCGDHQGNGCEGWKGSRYRNWASWHKAGCQGENKEPTKETKEWLRRWISPLSQLDFCSKQPFQQYMPALFGG